MSDTDDSGVDGPPGGQGPGSGEGPRPASGTGAPSPPAGDPSEGWTAGEIAALAEARAKKAVEAAEAAKAAAEAKAQEEYKVAAKEATPVAKDSGFTNKRAGEVIFRREMGEPEFWLTKEGLVPPRPILSPEEEKAISERVEIPYDQIPDYRPEHVLSPEYSGMSSYEVGVDGFREQLEADLARLRADPGATASQIRRAEEDLSKMDTLYENYHIGMNVFRTAKGGRDRIKK